ncbi:hypothetical protein LTR36_005458 [Oleoguttula mirabilis]|uniref:Monooxygenase n=1 Tax=Oleoguttula mirabilis TaxID=1507867 RepID=A0AAV9JEW7_9PEZI|nr:hypothetical protein LTR36_005458 [Oleoguttula mirabilis]
MAAAGKDFVGLVPPKAQRPPSAFFGPAGRKNILRDQFSITTWLALGAAAQAGLFLLAGRLALAPAVAILLYRTFTAYAMSVGWLRNTYMDGVLPNKFTAQFPDAAGRYGATPAASDVVVFLIGARCNHPLGLLAPGFQQLGGYFMQMVQDVEAHSDAEAFGFLGMTSWLNSNGRETGSELMEVGYFRSVEGLHKFAHSEYHRAGWDWWNKHVAQYPHLSIFHETYHVPKGHWENIYVNSHLGGINSTTHRYVDEQTGEEMWASPVVDASRGLLRTSAGRMSRSKADEHDQYGDNPYQ